MKTIFIGVLPLIIFALVEWIGGTFWGLIAAVVWAFLECAYQYWRTGRVDKLTVTSTVLIVLFGGVDLWMEGTSFFKLQPVVMEVAFAFFLIWDRRREKPFLLQLLLQARPDFNKPHLIDVQKIILRRTSLYLIATLLIHSVVLAYLALHQSTGSWILWKSIGLFVLLPLAFGIEFILMRRKQRR